MNDAGMKIWGELDHCYLHDIPQTERCPFDAVVTLEQL